MYSAYEQLAKEQFYPVARLESETPRLSRPDETPKPNGLVAGVVEALKHTPVLKDGKLDSGRLLLLAVTVLLFLEDSESESDLLIIAAAMFLLGL